MFAPQNARYECSKTPEQIRDEAAKATAADLAAIYDACSICPSDDAKLQIASQMFWRHREEIRTEATQVHFCPPDNRCDAPAAGDATGDDKLTH